MHRLRRHNATSARPGGPDAARPPGAVIAAPDVVRSDGDAFRATDWLLFSAVSVIWGSSYLLIKIGITTLHPGVVTVGRIALGTLALWLVRTPRATIAAGDRARLVVLSLVWVAVPFTLFPLAELHIDSAVTGMLTGATPLFGMVFGALWFGRRFGAPHLVGLAVGAAGVVMIGVGANGQGQGGTAVVGVVMTLVATVCYGYAANLAGPLQRRYGPVTTIRWTLTLATIWTLPFGLVGLRTSTFDVAAVVALGVISTGLAFVMMAALVGGVGGARASFVAYAIPAVALVVGVTVGGEAVSALAAGGVVLVIGGAVLAARPERADRQQAAV